MYILIVIPLRSNILMVNNIVIYSDSSNPIVTSSPIVIISLFQNHPINDIMSLMYNPIEINNYIVH